MSSGLSTSDGTDADSDVAGLSAAAEDLSGEASLTHNNTHTHTHRKHIYVHINSHLNTNHAYPSTERKLTNL